MVTQRRRTLTGLEACTCSLLLLLILCIGYSPSIFSSSPVSDMTHELTGYLIKVRSRAVSAGMAYKIEATSYGRLVALVSNRCDDRQWREDPQLTLHLPQGVELDAPNGSICYTSQGSSDRAERFALHTPTGRSRTIEIRESGEFNIL